jgi:hypothetical protein
VVLNLPNPIPCNICSAHTPIPSPIYGELRPGTWVVNQRASMKPPTLVQLLRGFSTCPQPKLGAASVAVAVRGGAVVPLQYADLAVELARWPAGAWAHALAGRVGGCRPSFFSYPLVGPAVRRYV